MYYCKEYFDDSNEKKSNEENQMYKFILKTSKLLEIEQRNMRNFGFSGFANFLQKCKSFLSLWLESSISRNIRDFFRVGFL